MRKFIRRTMALLFLVIILTPAFLYSAKFNLITRKSLAQNNVAFYTNTGDLDGDGKKELISYKSDQSGNQKILVNELNGSLLENKTEFDVQVSDTHNAYTFMQVADLDGDNKSEIVVAFLDGMQGIKVLKYANSVLSVQAYADLSSLIGNAGGISGLAVNGGDIYAIITYLNPTVLNSTSTTLAEQPILSKLIKVSYSNGSLSAAASLGGINGLAYNLKILNGVPVFAVLSVNITGVNDLINTMKNYSWLRSPALQRSPAMRKMTAQLQDIVKTSGINSDKLGKYIGPLTKLPAVKAFLNKVGSSILKRSPLAAGKDWVSDTINEPYNSHDLNFNKREYSLTGRSITFPTFSPLLVGTLYKYASSAITKIADLPEEFCFDIKALDTKIVFKSGGINWTEINRYLQELSTNKDLIEIAEKETWGGFANIPSPYILDSSVSKDEYSGHSYSYASDYKYTGAPINNDMYLRLKGMVLTSFINPLTGDSFVISDAVGTGMRIDTNIIPKELPQLQDNLLTGHIGVIDGTTITWSKYSGPLSGFLAVFNNEIYAASGNISKTVINNFLSAADGFVKYMYANMNSFFGSGSGEEASMAYFKDKTALIPSVDKFISADIMAYDALGTKKAEKLNAAALLQAAKVLDSDANSKNEVVFGFFDINWGDIDAKITEANKYIYDFANFAYNKIQLRKKQYKQLLTQLNKWAVDYHTWQQAYDSDSSTAGKRPIFSEDFNGNGKLDGTDEDIGISGLPSSYYDTGYNNGQLDTFTVMSTVINGTTYVFSASAETPEDLNHNGILDVYNEDVGIGKGLGANNNKLDNGYLILDNQMNIEYYILADDPGIKTVVENGDNGIYTKVKYSYSSYNYATNSYETIYYWLYTTIGQNNYSAAESAVVYVDGIGDTYLLSSNIALSGSAQKAEYLTEDRNNNGKLDNFFEDVGLDKNPNTNDMGEGDGKLTRFYYVKDAGAYVVSDSVTTTVYTEDKNGNGILDYDEDLNNNGKLDAPSEDVNGNGTLDAGEDLNGDGIIDYYGYWPDEHFEQLFGAPVPPAWMDDKFFDKADNQQMMINIATYGLRVLEEDGSGGFTNIFSNDNSGKFIVDIDASDMNKDNNPDLVLTGINWGWIKHSWTETRYVNSYRGPVLDDYGRLLEPGSAASYYYSNSYETVTRDTIEPAYLRGVYTVFGSVSTFGDITGYVKSAKDSSAIVDAQVVLRGYGVFLKKTDAAGKFSAHIPAPATYDIIVKADGYEDYITDTGIVVDTAPEVSIGTVYLKTLSSLSGKITTTYDTGIYNAAIRIVSEINPLVNFGTITDYAGNFGISNIKGGTYTVYVRDLDYVDTSFSIYITGDKTLNVALKSANASVKLNVKASNTGGPFEVYGVAIKNGAALDTTNIVGVPQKLIVDNSGYVSADINRLENGVKYDIYIIQILNYTPIVLKSDTDVSAPGADTFVVAPQAIEGSVVSNPLEVKAGLPEELYAPPTETIDIYLSKSVTKLVIKVLDKDQNVASSKEITSGLNSGLNEISLSMPSASGFYLFSAAAYTGTETATASITKGVKRSIVGKKVLDARIEPAPVTLGETAAVYFEIADTATVTISAWKTDNTGKPTGSDLINKTITNASPGENNEKIYFNSSTFSAGLYYGAVKYSSSDSSAGFFRVIPDVVEVSNIYAPKITTSDKATKVYFTLSKADSVTLRVTDSLASPVISDTTVSAVEGDNYIDVNLSGAKESFAYFYVLKVNGKVYAGMIPYEKEQLKINSFVSIPRKLEVNSEGETMIFAYNISQTADADLKYYAVNDLTNGTPLYQNKSLTGGAGILTWSVTGDNAGIYIAKLTITSGGQSVSAFAPFKIEKKNEKIITDEYVFPSNAFSPSSGQNVIVFYTVASDYNVKMAVFDRNFNVIYDTSVNAAVGIANSFVWLGKDNDGNVVNDGSYRIVLRAGEQTLIRRVRVQTSDITPPKLSVKITRTLAQKNSVKVNVFSNETLNGVPTVLLDDGSSLSVSRVGNSNLYTADYTDAFGGEISSLTVTVSGSDLSGNQGSAVGYYQSKTITKGQQKDYSLSSGETIGINIPASFKSSDINITSTTPPESIEDTGLAVQGNAVELSLPEDSGVFSEPVDLEIPYDENALGTVSTDQLGVYYWDEDLEKWVFVGGTVDKDKKVVKASTYHFTTFAVAADVVAPDTPKITGDTALSGGGTLVTGYAEPGTKLEMYIDGALVASGFADEQTGEFSITTTVAGSGNLVAVDNAGNASSATAFSIAAGSTTESYSNADVEVYNYPNPFNPGTSSTTIAFSVPSGSTGSATVKIFNVAGELVWSQEVTGLTAGKYNTVVWDGNNSSGYRVATGVYFAVVTVGDKAGVGKIAAIRGFSR